MATKARKKNLHDFKYAKGKNLEKGARRHSLRKGTVAYNKYRYGTISRRMAAKHKRRGGK